MAKPGFFRNVGGWIVNNMLSPGTTPYGPNGQYNGTLLRNGAINLAAGAVNPLAGQAAKYATNHWGGGMGQEAGQQGYGWLANQSIKPQGGLPYMPSADFAPVQGVDLPQGWQPATEGNEAPTTNPQQSDPTQLAGIVSNGYTRDSRSGSSAGSSVLAEGQAAQDMVGGWQLSNFLKGPQAPQFGQRFTRQA